VESDETFVAGASNFVPLRMGHWNSYDTDDLEVSVLGPFVGIMDITWNILVLPMFGEFKK
jgi:hypothetical protein